MMENIKNKMEEKALLLQEALKDAKKLLAKYQDVKGLESVCGALKSFVDKYEA